MCVSNPPHIISNSPLSYRTSQRFEKEDNNDRAVYVYVLKKDFKYSSLFYTLYCFLIIVLPEYPREALTPEWKLIHNQKFTDFFLYYCRVSIYLKKNS